MLLGNPGGDDVAKGLDEELWIEEGYELEDVQGELDSTAVTGSCDDQEEVWYYSDGTTQIGPSFHGLESAYRLCKDRLFRAAMSRGSGPGSHAPESVVTVSRDPVRNPWNRSPDKR